jgi:hypothetical protein
VSGVESCQALKLAQLLNDLTSWMAQVERLIPEATFFLQCEVKELIIAENNSGVI